MFLIGKIKSFDVVVVEFNIKWVGWISWVVVLVSLVYLRFGYFLIL